MKVVFLYQDSLTSSDSKSIRVAKKKIVDHGSQKEEADTLIYQDAEYVWARI